MDILGTGPELEKRWRDPIPLIIGAIVVILGAGAAFYIYRQSQPAVPEPVLTDEARSYLPHLDLSGVEMKASDTFLGQTLVEITGKITNQGDRTVELVEINCVFRDINGVEIAREPRVVVGPKTGALGPKEQKAFRLAFDGAPEGWNQALPSLFVAQIVFAEEKGG